MIGYAPGINIGGNNYGPPDHTLIIAEIGTAHRGDVDRAQDLITAAADAGANCVKFQMVYADEILHPLTGAVDLPGGATDLYTEFTGLEQEVSFYADLKRYSEAAGLLFLCTPFGPRSAEQLHSLGVSALKIASPEINHTRLLQHVRETHVPLILSTGVSLLSDIEYALGIIGVGHALLHCVTSYPAPVEEYNLNCIPAMKTLFGAPVGVSDHSQNPVIVPALAVALGAFAVEKHFTLDNDGGGLDDPIALAPNEFSEMVAAIRAAERATVDETIHTIGSICSAATVNAVLGTGMKMLAPSEAQNYLTTNRSILAKSDIKAGTHIADSNIGLYRSEKNLTPGLHPQFLAQIIGKQAVKDISAGSGLRWDDLLTD